jgi:hypothetical protein
MTDAERLELQRATVSRNRAHMTHERSTRGRAAAQKQNYARPPGRMTLAAQYAAHANVTISAAARKFGVCVASAAEAWRRIYPDVPALVSRRGARL